MVVNEKHLSQSATDAWCSTHPVRHRWPDGRQDFIPLLVAAMEVSNGTGISMQQASWMLELERDYMRTRDDHGFEFLPVAP